MKAKINRILIEVIQENILNLPVEAIVVVTDPNLSIDKKLSALAGPIVEQQTTEIGWADVGQSVITDAGNLPIKKIIHTVGPRWGEGSERGKLETATWTSLQIAEDNHLASVAFPAISVGTLGYPIEACAKIMVTRVIDFTFEKLQSLKSITLCLVDEPSLKAFQSEFEQQIRELRETGEGKVARA